MNSASNPRYQAGNTLYIVLSVLVLLGIGLVLYMMNQADDSDIELMPTQEDAVLNAEPPAIQTVDMQDAEIETSPQVTEQGSQATLDQSAEAGLFERTGRKLPLTDGLAGGTEAQQPSDGNAKSNSDQVQKVHALDAFDFGVLDGRVRIGVFGKGPIPDYRVTLTQSYYLIDMPGEFRYIDEFQQALLIERFGVARAQLSRSRRGIQMRIDVTPALRHEPFLIEDAKGLMIAFEPTP